MYLYRNYNCKGIVKIFCAHCGCYHYVSFIGRELKNDYMYSAFQQLLGNKTVSIEVDKKEFDNDFDSGYEKDNDYERHGIIHLTKHYTVSHYHATVELEQLVFEKGQNYDFYGRRLFKHPGTDFRCPYCYSSKLIYGNMDASLDEFVSQIKVTEEDKKDYVDIVNAVMSDYDALPYHKLMPADDPDSAAKEYLKHLVDTETNILFFKKRLAQLYENEWIQTRVLYDDYLMSKLPNLGLIPDVPQKPELKRPGLFNRAHVEAENNALLAAYNASCQTSLSAQQKYNSDRDAFFHKFDDRYTDLREAIDDGDFSSLQGYAPAFAIRKAEIIYREIEECNRHLKTLVQERNELCSMNVIFPKYLSYPALTTIYEYLQCGRCSTLSGPNGAYNLYESELTSHTIIGKLDQIIDSLEQIKRNQYSTYQLLQSIEVNTAMLNSSMDDMLDSMKEANGRLSNIEQNTQDAAYYSHKAACYSAITAAETATSTYLALYNHS